MTTQFYADPAAGIFRAAYAGKDAISPAKPTDIYFDAFGLKCQGVTLSGIVPWSALTAGGFIAYTPPPNSTGAAYYALQINFAAPLPYVPLVVANFQSSSGVWSPTFVGSSITYYNVGGIFFPQGTTAVAGIMATKTYVLLYFNVVLFVNSTGYSTPTNYSYKIFGV